MKKIVLTLLICGFTFTAKSQEASVEKSTYGIQVGFLGIWGHTEFKLSNQIALRSELGLDSGIFSENVNDDLGFFMVPTITLEPRWYYNLNKRQNKSRRIDGNSGNFIALKTTYHSDLFIVSSQENLTFITDISIVPTWAIRRNIGEHFTYETGIGIGYVHYFEKDNIRLLDENEVAINLHLRLGYRF